MAKGKMPQRMWMYAPGKAKREKLPESLKAEVEKEAEALMQEWRLRYIKEPPKEKRFNYIEELYTKWYRNYFYFCARYACPGPEAISPHFEVRFTRLEYIGDGLLNLAFMRHTGQWVEVETELSVAKCFQSIRGDGFYHPS